MKNVYCLELPHELTSAEFSRNKSKSKIEIDRLKFLYDYKMLDAMLHFLIRDKSLGIVLIKLFSNKYLFLRNADLSKSFKEDILNFIK